KGFLPTYSEEVRKRNVEDAKIADLVVLGNYNSDIFKILEEIKPDIVALGYDQRVKEAEILKRFPGLEIIRMEPYQSDKYKSSFYRK
ncbi:MAG: hypothetical protein KG029_08445, partial [Bacteroidetes bacterium]|nr:hypothetical protein [Bacteroidota bacterium]